MQNYPSPLPPLTNIPADIVTPNDYVRYAKERLSDSYFAYLASGSGQEITSQENCQAWQRIKLEQRPLKDFAGAHTQLDLAGTKLDYPILLAPIAYHKLVHSEGELATAQAAAAMRALYVVSAQASTRLEDIAKVAAGPRWFQLIWQADHGFMQQLMARVHANGYAALVLTTDAPITGLKHVAARAGFTLPKGVSAVNLEGARMPQHTTQAGGNPLFGSALMDNAPCWEDLHWLIKHSPLPVFVKGITHPEDVEAAIQAGACGIIVSNHGGRSLDGLPASAEVLPRVCKQVANRVPVLMDGGIRSGADIFKALALGAQAVLVGRPCIYALAVAGATGVAHVLHMLRTELETTMILAGTPTLADITSECIYQPMEHLPGTKPA